MKLREAQGCRVCKTRMMVSDLVKEGLECLKNEEKGKMVFLSSLMGFMSYCRCAFKGGKGALCGFVAFFVTTWWRRCGCLFSEENFSNGIFVFPTQ